MNYLNMIMPVLCLIANDTLATMVLFTAYINDELGYEHFCYDYSEPWHHNVFAEEHFYTLCDTLRKSESIREALKDGGILKKGVNHYILGAMDDFDMWYHLLDGTHKILKDPVLVEQMPSDLRYVAVHLFNLCVAGELNDANWDDTLEKLRSECR
jgi:hypothetical protein